jgi:hypothetical protein
MNTFSQQQTEGVQYQLSDYCCDSYTFDSYLLKQSIADSASASV